MLRPHMFMHHRPWDLSHTQTLTGVCCLEGPDPYYLGVCRPSLGEGRSQNKNKSTGNEEDIGQLGCLTRKRQY